jgi:hypothetical protein
MSVAKFISDHYDVLLKIENISTNIEKNEARVWFENGVSICFNLEVIDDIQALNAAHQKQMELLAIQKANRIHRFGWHKSWEPEDGEIEMISVDVKENQNGKYPVEEDVYSQRISEFLKRMIT